MKSRTIAPLFLALFFAFTAPPVLAMPADEPLNADLRGEIVDRICQAINTYYVFPDVAQQMEEHVRARLKEGAYDATSDRVVFAGQLTEDLRSVSHDLHLHVDFLPPDGHDGETLTPEQRRAQFQERVRRGNFGFEKLEHLSGNVGYLDLRGFLPAELGGDTAVAAMNFLSNSDAVIIDLRQNGGGDPSMIQLISSYFFEEPVHLNSFYIRSQDSLKQFWTSAWTAGKKMANVDLYVLTSGRTFSAAEEFTYNMKNLKRATIVGETTGGGAHPTDFHAFPDLGVGISVPFGRAINPITKTNWEGTGVAPDVEVPQEQALAKAHAMALKRLLEKAEKDGDEGRETELRWEIEAIQTRLEPARVPTETLRRYAGQYGPRTVTWEEGSLYYQRLRGPRYRLAPVSSTVFIPEGLSGFRIEFETDASGNATGLIGRYVDGRTDKSPRS